MLNEKLHELVIDTSEVLNLRESVIEKDYHVTRAIQSLAGIENEFFRLVFSGGTCLAKAYKIVKRMSEDIDFKIRLKKTDKTFSKNHLLKELKKFRMQIMSSLTIPDLIVTDSAVQNEGKYLRVELIYPTSFTVNDTLRPHLLLEFTYSDVRLPTESLNVRTIIEDVIKSAILSPSSSIECVSADEMAVEKWVALTRRIAAIARGYHHDDHTLVRHIYDLEAIKHANKIDELFFDLAKIVIKDDANQFKNQHPEYFNNPAEEIRHSLKTLKNEIRWKERYQRFIDSMVYDRETVNDYENTIESLESASNKVIASLS